MRRFIAIMLMFWVTSVGAQGVFAEERKSLEELLVEKEILTKEEAASLQSKRLSKWVDRMIFSGDFRLRHESFMKDQDKNRSRQRFRLRLGSELKMDDF